MQGDQDPWTLAPEPPADAEPEQLLRLALHFAILAPSPGNTQPWRFLLEGDRVDLFTDPARQRPAHDPDGQQRIVAGGAALGLLRVALRAFNLAETTDLLPGDHPDLLARVTLIGSVASTPEERWLLQAAPKRRTHRGPFSAHPIRHRLLARLADMAQETGAPLAVLGPEARAAFARRLDDCLARDAADPRILAERADWPTPGAEPFTDVDGVPARDDAILAGSPTLALLTTDRDDPHAWLVAGQALTRVLLRARVDQVYATFLSAPLARAAARAEVAEQSAVLDDMSHSPGYAQLALRLGLGSDLPPTPRRPLSSVLLAAPP